MGIDPKAVRPYLDDPSDEEEQKELVAYVERALARRLRYSGKVCSTCEESKQLSAFGADERQRDGLKKECKECIAEATRARRKNVV